MSKARTAIKMSPTRRKRFLGQLKLLQCQINGEVKPAKVPVPELQRHYRKQLVEPCLPCPMHWELSAASSQSNYVALDGPPVHTSTTLNAARPAATAMPLPSCGGWVTAAAAC